MQKFFHVMSKTHVSAISNKFVPVSTANLGVHTALSHRLNRSRVYTFWSPGQEQCLRLKCFIRLRQDTLQLAAERNGEATAP